VDRPKSLGFPHAANGPPLFVVPRGGYHRFSANNGGIRCERRCWRWRRSARLGRHVRSLLPGRRSFRRRGPITPRLKKLPVADLARVAHGGGPGSAVLMGAGARLAAAAIGTPLAVLAASQASSLASQKLRDCPSRRRRLRPAPVSA